MKKTITFLDYIIYWAIVLIPFSIAVGPAFTYIFMGFLAFSFLLKKLLKGERLFMHTPLNLPFLCIFVISLISFKNSIDYHSSLQGIGKLAQDAFIFLICAEEIRDRRHIKRIVLFLILGASLASFDALWQLSFGRDFIRGHQPILNIGLRRATAAFPNANVFGVYLSAIAPLVVGLALYYFRGKIKILMLALSCLVTFGIISTFSRGTALAFYIAILFISICRKGKAMVSALLILLLLFPLIMPRNIKNWAKNINYNPIVFMLNADRVSIYRNTFNMIKHHPFIGVGVNTFSRNYLTYKLPEPEGATTGDSMYAHNHFMHMAGEIGLIGLGIFLWLLFALFKQAARVYKKLKDDYIKILSLCITAGLIAFLINGMTETSLYYARVAMIFWYLAGFSLALSRFTNAHQP